MKPPLKKLIDGSKVIVLISVIFLSCSGKMKECGVSDEIWAGLEETERLTSIDQTKQIPVLIEELYRKHPAKTLEELSLKYEYLLKYHFYYGTEVMIYQYIDSLEMVSDPDDQDCYRGRSTLQFTKAYLENRSGGSLLDIIQLHEEGKSYNARFKEECRVKLTPFTLPSIYGSQQKYDEAIHYLKDELKQSENCLKFTYRFDFANHQGLLNSIGVYYERMMLIDSAEVYYLKALDFVQQKTTPYVTWDNFSKLAEAVIKGNLGGVYIHKKRYDLAEKYLKASIAINDHPEMDIEDALLTKIKLLELYYVSQRKLEAMNLLQLLVNDTLLNQYIEAELRLSKFASHLYKNEGNYKEALKWHERYKSAVDEKNHQFEQQRTRDVEEKIAHVNQKFSYEILDRKNTIKSRTLWGMSLIGLLSILLISLLWNKRKEHKKHIENLSILNDKVVSKNKELLTSLNDLQVSQEENKKLMKVLAHDLRTPIAAIVNMSDLLVSVDMTPEEKTELIKLQKESGLSLLSMIKDLLSPTVNNTKNRASVDINALIKNCIATLKPLASKKNLRVHLKGDDVEIMGHREKLWRLMSNLLSNAIKFSYDDSDIFVTVENKAESVEIRIEDTGMGIPEDQLDSLFSISSRVGRPGTQGEKSFGMGLAICKQIVDVHNGNISCQSKVGKGTTITIELPVI